MNKLNVFFRYEQLNNKIRAIQREDLRYNAIPIDSPLRECLSYELQDFNKYVLEGVHRDLLYNANLKDITDESVDRFLLNNYLEEDCPETHHLSRYLIDVLVDYLDGLACYDKSTITVGDITKTKHGIVIELRGIK